MSIEQQHLQTYRDLFVHRGDLYARQTSSGSYFLKREPVTDDVIRAHLEGKITAGWYALNPNNTVRWLALDADRPDGLDQLQDAACRLDRRGVTSHLERSRRGGHLWVFFEQISAHVARRLILGSLPDLEGVEVYPKQDRLDSAGRIGNLVRGPLGIHRLTGRRYPFVYPLSLKPISASVRGTIEYLATADRMTGAQAAEHLAVLLDEANRTAPTVPPTDKPLASRISLNSRSPIEQIKEQIGDVYQFVSHYVELDQAGKGHCPFHPPDTHRSFVVNREGGYWVCFHQVDPKTGRYLGGDAIEFYRRLNGLTNREALEELRAMFPPHSHQGSH